MSETADQTITLVSKDGDEFTLGREAALISALVGDSLGVTADAEGQEESSELEQPDPIHIMKVDGACLSQVVEFLEKQVKEPFEEVPSPLPADTLEKCVTQEWYFKFISSKDRDETFALMQAANYMNIKPLLDLVVLHITFAICGKAPEFIREYLKLAQPAAPEAEEGGEEGAAAAAEEGANDEKKEDDNGNNNSNNDNNNNDAMETEETSS